MSITVKHVNDLCIKNKDIDTIVKEHLEIIDDKLLHSNQSFGNNFIIHYLPINIVGVPGLDKQDTQRIVYSSIICSLEKRGFDVKIVLEENYSMLYVNWKSRLNTDNINIMNTIIKDKLITKSELNNLLNNK